MNLEVKKKPVDITLHLKRSSFLKIFMLVIKYFYSEDIMLWTETCGLYV